MMKKSFFLLLLLSFHFSIVVFAQPGSGYQKNYRLLRSGNITIDKNFYLLTAISQSADVSRLLLENKVLSALFQAKRSYIHQYAGASTLLTDSILTSFSWQPEDSAMLIRAVADLYDSNSAPFDQLIDHHLRPSGYYERFVHLDNKELLLGACTQYCRGINYIIAQFGLGKKLRYPDIDSASYDVKGPYFRYMLKPMFNFLDEQVPDRTLFYQPSLQVAARLMDINDRNEPAQFEPLEAGENKAAFQQAQQVKWETYTYSAILVPGEGPEITTISLSPGGKMRCELAAARFKKGIAPFIIVSGGNCHPFHTPYNEAIEMKRYLVNTLKIPENAVIIEPQARHTTTNFRNGNRLIIHYGMPVNKPALCVTTSDQATYIEDKRFDNRNTRELGYLPYREKKRTSPHEIVFYPVMDCLHMDPFDPLDP